MHDHETDLDALAGTSSEVGLETSSRVGGLRSEVSDHVLITTLDDSWVDRAGEALALSFVDEPAFEWMLGGTPRWRRRVMALSFRASLHGHRHSIQLHGALLDGRLIGVGVRFPPGRWPPTRWESIRASPWRLVGLLVRLIPIPPMS